MILDHNNNHHNLYHKSWYMISDCMSFIIFSNYLVRNCKFSFNSDQTFVKNDKIKSQFYKTWVRKHTKIQILCTSSSSNNNKSNYNVHIITDKDYKSDFDKSHKHLKN